MTRKPNPDIYRPIEVPESLKPFVRRILVADSRTRVDMTVDVRATGYHYLGWIWRGRWQGQVNEETLFDSEFDGPLHLTGQVKKGEVIAKMQGNIGQIFLEFTAFGHFQLLGVPGADLLENACAPHVLNPSLAPHFAKILAAKDMSLDARLDLLADVLCSLPKQKVPDGLTAAIARIEAADGAIRLSELLGDLELAERKFRADFKSLTGLTPKVFCKTLQVTRAFNQLITNNGGDLASVAAKSGFSDQAHFTRAFGTFLGKSPGRYLGNVEQTLARFVGQARS